MLWKPPKVKEEDILHYLGSQMMDELLHKQVEEMMTLLNQDVRCQVIYRTLPLENHQCRYIKLQGKSIQTLLKESHAVIIMAATLGIKTDRRLRALEISDMGKAYVYNACANAMIEAVCDDVNEQLRRQYAKRQAFLTDRFSCGYGDLPVSTQKTFLQVVDAERKIGLHVSESCMLVPEKSVTAIIGIAKTVQPAIVRGCRVCALKEHCEYRKGGTVCER